jgi:hypothetical protein
VLRAAGGCRDQPEYCRALQLFAGRETPARQRASLDIGSG